MKVDVKQLKNEENIKLALYKELSAIEEIDVFGEYRINRSRCDLVVTKDNEVLYGIEVKRSSKPSKRTKQKEKYKLNNVPVIYCYKSDVDKVVSFVDDNLYNLDYLNKNLIIEL